MKLFAEIISWVFMPLLTPVYALLIVMYVPAVEQQFYGLECQDCIYLLQVEVKKALLYMFVIFCVVAPGFSFVLLKRNGVIISLEMETRQERNVPIIIMFIYCIGLYFMLIYTASAASLPKFIYALPLSGAAVTGFFVLLNQWKKVSIHAAGVGILAGFILAYTSVNMKFGVGMLIAAILLSGVVMAARSYLQKHTMQELLVGWLTGFIITFSVNYFY
ncbi:MAG: hypothetical protein QNK85_06475 [Crocinitomicaceae bacterium]|jgi:membrane-associated phospholipid phosphatase